MVTRAVTQGRIRVGVYVEYRMWLASTPRPRAPCFQQPLPAHKQHLSPLTRIARRERLQKGKANRRPDIIFTIQQTVYPSRTSIKGDINMVKYTCAALVIITTAELGAAATTSSAFVNLLSQKPKASSPHINSRRYSAIPYDEFAENFDDSGVVLPSFSSTVSLLDLPEDNQAEVDALLAKKEKRRVARLQSAGTPNYQITLPLSGSLIQPPPLTTYEASEGAGANKVEALASLVAKGQEIALSNTIGMSLRQVYSGKKLSELALDVDTMRFQSFDDELQGRRMDGGEDAQVSGSVQVLQNSALEMLKESFDGVIVSSVARGGLAWQSGVRAGDVLIATSATIGSKLWPKSTLDGVRSAISSRKVILPTMDFEFRRLAPDEVDAVEAVKSFELSLSRPIGINVEGETRYLSCM